MSITEFFENNNFLFLEKKESQEFFGNYEILYKKDGVVFILSSERGQKFLELKKENGNESIYISLLLNSDKFYSEKEIINSLANNYSKLIKKMNSLTDEDIHKLKVDSIKRRLKISI